jgi:hypothetical protein
LKGYVCDHRRAPELPFVLASSQAPIGLGGSGPPSSNHGPKTPDTPTKAPVIGPLAVGHPLESVARLESSFWRSSNPRRSLVGNGPDSGSSGAGSPGSARADRKRIQNWSDSSAECGRPILPGAVHASATNWPNWDSMLLRRDRDCIYGVAFTQRVAGMGIKQKLIAPRSPWQNPFVERLIGSVRRECLDRMIVLNEAQLHRILKRYFHYYHGVRPHRSLERDSPLPRPALRVWLLPRNLPMKRPNLARDGIRDFKKQNHR